MPSKQAKCGGHIADLTDVRDDELKIKSRLFGLGHASEAVNRIDGCRHTALALTFPAFILVCLPHPLIHNGLNARSRTGIGTKYTGQTLRLCFARGGLCRSFQPQASRIGEHVESPSVADLMDK